MRLKDEQIIQVSFQAQIRTSQLLVRVVRPAAFLIDRPFVEKALMLLKPRLQGALEGHLAAGLSALAPAATTPCQLPFSGCVSGIAILSKFYTIIHFPGA